jgi:hypothetical protein
MGFGRESIQPDDEIVIIRGGKVPFAIRDVAKPSGHVKLIRDLYVHGVMDEEGVAVIHGKDDIAQRLLV